MGKKISFSEELLSGYLDGELSEEDAHKVHQFASSSQDLREDLDSLVRMGEIFSTNFQNAPEELNIWQAIEGKLSAKQPLPEIERSTNEPAKVAPTFWSKIFLPRFGAALALGLFAVGMLSSQWVELPAAKKEEAAYSKITESDLALNKSEILVPLIQKNRPATSQTFVSNGFNSQPKNDFTYSPQFISPQQLGAEHPARGTGVRADGMQIEWMKNSKDVRFLRHKNDSLPPTIWLGDLR